MNEPAGQPHAPVSSYFRGHVFGILILVLLAPFIALITYTGWMGIHPFSTIIGVGRVSVAADTGVISIVMQSPTSDPQVRISVLTAQAATITQYLEDHGIDSSRIANLSLGDIEVSGFTSADDFSSMTSLVSQTRLAFPDTTVSAKYHYTLDDAARTQAIESAIKNARLQAQGIGEAQGRKLIYFAAAVCNTQIVDASQSFNPSSCDDRAYSTETSAKKQVIVTVKGAASFSF